MRIRISFQIIENVAPLSIMAFIIMINHLAGMILLMICKGRGILEIGNINPERMITGSISPINEIIIAICCELDIVEIKIPNDKAVMMNNTVTNASKNRLP